MRTMLRLLRNGETITIGGFGIYAYDDGTLTVRCVTGLMGPSVKPNLAGLRYLLAWMDSHIV